MRVRISPGARKVNQTGALGSPAKRSVCNSISFEYCTFRVKKRIRIPRFLTWIAGYLVISVVLLAMEMTVGHNQWSVWSYASFGCDIAWVIASFVALVKGWFYV